ncbi:acid protease [Gyrodon lividus]|nr:acid protease [Gyrodon lividus]
MRFTLVTVSTALTAFVAAAPKRVTQGGMAIPLALSKRSSLVNADKSVNLEVLKSHVASTGAKIRRGFDNFEKNTNAPHPSAVKGIRKRASGGLSLGFFANHPITWFSTISIGTPPRLYTVEFDTGSSDLVLPGINCDDSCEGHDLYDPLSSLTSADTGNPFYVEYGNSDSAYGLQYTDNVTIVGLEAIGQTLGAAWHYSHGLQYAQFFPDGLLGMAFQSISRYDESPVFQTLVTQGKTDEPVFAFGLAGPQHELYLGGTNPDMYIGDFTWTSVIQHGFWEVNMDNIMGNGQVVLTNVAGIVDTGTDLIHGKPSDVANLYQAIGGTYVSNSNGVYAFPCNAVPSVSFTFRGSSFPIPAQTFNIGANPIDPSTCIGAIVSGRFTSWIIGSVFLRQVYAAFDLANARVGFATPA